MKNNQKSHHQNQFSGFLLLTIIFVLLNGCKDEQMVTPPVNFPWRSQISGTTQNLKAIQFLDSSTACNTVGIVTGNNGTILRTTDKGNTWNMIISGTYENLYGLHFPNSTTGFIVGSSGIILKSTNAGYTWNIEHIDSSYILFSVYASNDVYPCFAAGTHGHVLESDRSSVWNARTDLDTEDLYSIKMEQNIIAAGTNGTIISSNFYDTLWMNINSGTQNNLNSLYFVNDFTGYSTGQNGIILKSVDQGMSWHTQQSNTSNWLNAIRFGIDTVCGFTVGESGIFLKTTNGGTNWKVLQTTTTNYLRDVYFIDQKNGWVVGENGTILYTSTGGE